MMNIWNWLNNKKTIIGILAKAVTLVITQLNPEMAETMKTADGYIDLWILGGITHKIAKVADK